MNKIYMALLIGILGKSVFAKTLLCPSTITCDYEEGSCNQSIDWYLEPTGMEPEFTGVKTFSLSSIQSAKLLGVLYNHGADLKKTPYVINYVYGKNYQEGRRIYIFSYVNKIIGNGWKISGFNHRAECLFISNPELCIGER